MKHGLLLCTAIVVAIVTPGVVTAGVVNTNHDMPYKGQAQKAGACSYCHIPHKAGGDKLWASTYSDTGVSVWTAEVISQLCFTCHGSGAPAFALEQNPFGGTNKHLRTVSVLTGFGDIAALPTDVDTSGDGNLKCTSCHNVHDNSKRPFLRFDTSAAGAYGLNLNCQKCHPNRVNNGLVGTNNVVAGASQHPVNITLPSNAASALAGSRAFFIAAQAEYAIVPGAQAPGVPGAVAAGWNLGGHRNDGLAGGLMGCQSCHAIHGDELNNYTAANGATPVGTPQTGFNHLTVRNGDPLATVNGLAACAPLCTGCHGNSATAGPGLSTLYTHPIGVSRNGSIFIVDVANGYKWGGPGNDILVCQSCHKIHYGAPNTSLLYGTIDTPTTTSNKNCFNCHSSGSVRHHPNGPLTRAPSDMRNSTRSTGPWNWTLNTKGTNGGSFQFGSNGEVMCYTCHYQSAAHNDSGLFNELVSYNVDSELCMDCHTSNPSVYTTVNGGGVGSSTVITDASHYIGPIQTTSYKRTQSWGTTGLSSKYGTAGVGNNPNGAIICQSCHTLELSGLLKGGTSSLNTPHANVRTSVICLLETSGNLNNLFATGITSNAADLCTGCHGASPQGGTAQAGNNLHPAISSPTPMIGITDPMIGPKINAEWIANGTVSLNSAGLINCESCHRPHDASNGSGALILEGCGSASTKTAGGLAAVAFDRATLNGGARYTDEAAFCNMCHSY